MAFKAESDDTRASLSFKLRKLLRGPAPASCARIRTSSTTGSCRSRRSSTESEILVLGVPHRRTGGSTFGAERDVVDIWGALGDGIRL